MQKRNKKEKPSPIPKRKPKMSRFQDVSSLIARIKKEIPDIMTTNLSKNSISNLNPEESPNINPKYQPQIPKDPRKVRNTRNK